ncbi:hypothetical protein XENOCAPTIV_012771 [Xenoophorus captivus]|uniref:Uncharacterized protein n=1 Tax=Xenoophorus captivus TaxID=1517983 RepID=A0ABV0RQG4_9TELE
MARDLTWGPVQANDGRRAYIPEAVQRDYHIPAVWADRLEDKVELRVKATFGEWANILMMPSYHTLATYQPLTSKFRFAYVGVVHDVMLRRLKKAAYKYAQEIVRQVDELSAEEEEEVPPLPSAPRSTGKPIGKMSEQPMASSPGADVFREYKMIKTLVREKRSEESSEDYIKDVWPMITNATERWLTVQFANGTVEEVPYGTWQGIIWVKGPYDLITVTDLKELNKPWGEHRSLSQRLSQLWSRLVKVGSTQSGTGAQEWYKAVDVQEVTEQKLKKIDFSPGWEGDVTEDHHLSKRGPVQE